MDAVFAVNRSADKNSYLNCVSMALLIRELDLRAIDTFDGFDGNFLETLDYVLQREVRCDKFVIVTIPDTHSGDFELGVLSEIDGFVGMLHRPVTELFDSDIYMNEHTIRQFRRLKGRIFSPKFNPMQLLLQLSGGDPFELTPEEKQEFSVFGHRTEKQDRALLRNYYLRVKREHFATVPKLLRTYRNCN